MNKLEEFLREVRVFEGLKNAILCGITVGKRDKSAEFFLVTDKAYTASETEAVRLLANKYLPKGFTAKMKIVKRQPDAEIIKRKIYEYVQSRFPAAAAFLAEDCIHVEMLTCGANFCFDIASGEQNLFTSGKILDDISAYLQSGYCGTFYGNVRIVEKQEPSDELLYELPETEEEEKVEIRRFPVDGFGKIDGVDQEVKQAVYIADCLNVEGPYSICGRLTYAEEKEYTKHDEKTGTDLQKTRFIFSVADNSGTLRVTYFPKKATLEKVRALKVGESVVITGQNEEYKGARSFKAVKLNLGTMPENYVWQAKKGKPVPKFYHTVFPEPYVDYTQAGLFDSLEKPVDLKDNVFVVFDLETTGLNNNPAMGKMDKIIEIGAVKLVNGEMTEKFSTFVACEERLSPEIIKLTGIQDGDLVGAPHIEQAIADFYKFIDGAYLVGHNVTFDYRFVRYYAEQYGYMIENKQYDTMLLSQELLRGEVVNNKLDTVASYFGYTFNHHRAFDDACVTAKIFIEFIKRRGKLPH